MKYYVLSSLVKGVCCDVIHFIQLMEISFVVGLLFLGVYGALFNVLSSIVFRRGSLDEIVLQYFWRACSPRIYRCLVSCMQVVAVIHIEYRYVRGLEL